MRQAFEESILESPDEVANYAAYADWLMEQNDPRGEFIQVQLALEDGSLTGPQRRKLKTRERSLLKKHEREWLGPLAPFLLDNYEGLRHEPNCEYQFRRGFLRVLRIKGLGYHLAIALTKTPLVKWLHELVVEDNVWLFQYEDADDNSPVLEGLPEDEDFFTPEVLIRSLHLRHLRHLQIGEDWDGEGRVESDFFVRVTDLIAQMPHLEELHLLAMGVNITRLFSMPSLANLRVLRMYHVGASRTGERDRYEYPIELLAANPARKNLERLYFHPHCEESHFYPDSSRRYSSDFRPSFLPLDKLRPLLVESNFPKLTHLQWRLSDMGNDGCRAIVESGILKRLKWLDLRHDCITDEGADILAECPDLRNLEFLEIGGNGLTATGIDALRATGINVQNSRGQQTRRQLENSEFLYEGESE